MLLSLSWGLGKYYKERVKYGEKIYFLTSLCHLFHLSSHIYLSFSFSSSSFFFVYYPSPPLFFSLCTLQFVAWTRNALTAFSQRAPISAALEENGARWRLQWRWSVGIFQKRLSHAAILQKPLLPFLLLYHTALLPSLIPPCHSRRWCCGGMLGRAETIDRASILSCENAPVWQSRRWQRAAQICCTLARAQLWWRLTTRGKQGQLQIRVLIWKEQRETHAQNSIPLWVFFWKINLPAETR